MRAPERTLERARELRREMSLPEVLLWDCLRSGRLEGLRFRRQHPIGPYVLDFYCAAARLAVEVDGVQHDHPEQIAHDRRRDRWLRDQGIRTMRIAATDILEDQAFEGMLVMIMHEVASGKLPPRLPPPPPTAVPLPRKRGRIQVAQTEPPRILPCEAGEGDHAKRGGGGGRTPKESK